MRIGIDCRAMQGRGGIATYTYNLVKNLIFQDKLNHYVLFFDPKVSQSLKKLPEQDNCSVEYFPTKGPLGSLPLINSHLLLSRFLKKQGLDIFHAPTGSLPLFYQGKTVVTVHDLAIYQNPEWFPSFQFFSKNIVIPQSFKKATYIIAVSETTKKDLLSLFSISSTKIGVIYEGGLGVSMIDQKKQKNTSEYILTVSTLEPRKNLIRLIRAFSLYRHQNLKSREKLIIIGGKGWKYKTIYKEVRRSGIEKEMVFTGYISEKEKIRWLDRAKVFIFPSLYEGFGLPVVEAMSLGVPVICSKRGALAEICGNAAFFVNPDDVQSIARGLGEVLGGKNKTREILKNRGLKRAQRFSWQKCARETLEVYQKVHYFL